MFPRTTFCFPLYIVILYPREEDGECPGDGGKMRFRRRFGRPRPSAAASSRGPSSCPPPPASERRQLPQLAVRRRRAAALGGGLGPPFFLPGRAAGALTYLVSVVAKIVFHGESILGCLWAARGAPGGISGGTPGAALGGAQRGLAGPGPPLPGAGVSAGLRIAADPGSACLQPGSAGSGARLWRAGPAAGVGPGVVDEGAPRSRHGECFAHSLRFLRSLLVTPALPAGVGAGDVPRRSQRSHAGIFG